MGKEELQPILGIPVSEPEQIAQVGLPAEKRLEILSQQPAGTVPRQINAGEQSDPFSLLRHEDTYEPLAGVIFQKCEGIFRQLADVNSSVRTQINKSKRSSCLRSVDLPEITLTDLYKYAMERTESETSIQYLFHRTDKGYEQNGFRVVKQDDGHIVLNSLEPENTDIKDDEKYYVMLCSAQRWVEDYSAALHINPTLLRELAKKEIGPYSFKVRAKRVGKTAAKPLIDIFVVSRREKNGILKRRPRFAALAATAILAPIPFHEIGTEKALTVGPLVTTGSAIGSIFNSSHHKSFDDYHRKLPGASEVAFGEKPVKIYYDANLNPKIEKDAPSSKHDIKKGTIRKRDFSFSLDGDYDYGISPGKCDTQYINLAGDHGIRIVTPSAAAAESLTVSASNTEVNVCNTSDVTVYEKDAILYLQPE